MSPDAPDGGTGNDRQDGRGGPRGERACAADVLSHFARWMAVGLGSLTMAFDPAMFVIGGGLSRAAPVYEHVLRQRFAEAVYASELRPLPVLSFAVLADRAGAVGAAFYGA